MILKTPDDAGKNARQTQNVADLPEIAIRYRRELRERKKAPPFTWIISIDELKFNALTLGTGKVISKASYKTLQR